MGYIDLLKTLNLYEYELPLQECSLQSATRKGLILESPEHEVYAESAPLPLYSKESYEKSREQLSSLLDTIPKISSEKELFHFFQTHSLYPSVTFCVYTLFEQLFSPPKYPCLFPIRHYIDIPYRGASSSEILLGKIHSLYTSSSQTFKIKLGSYPVYVAIDLMRSLLSFCTASIQLDINQRWSLEEVFAFCNSFDKEAFHSIEDPTKDPMDLFTLAKKYPHPISLDHTLRTHSIKQFLSLSSLKACEFKPTLDIHSILDDTLMKFLQDRSIEYTFSSSYESSIGIAAIGRLGMKYCPSSCLGIDTLEIFSHDLLSSSFYNANNQMIIEKPQKIKPEYVTLYETTTLSYL